MRILTAIMFTDIEGFTALMQRDESSAVEMLEQHKKTFLQCVGAHKGRVIKYLGDGTLTIFNSVLNAVECAISLQQALRKGPVIPVRIGIHTGEVLFENKDIIGDAVNLASRIQSKGVAGSVLISEKINEELANHPEIKTVSLGAHSLKNVLQPVKLYAIAAKGLELPSTQQMSPVEESEQKNPKKRKRLFGLIPVSLSTFVLAAIVCVSGLSYYLYANLEGSSNSADYLKTIAVLPFENKGTDTNNYLAEGLTEEMISLLSKNPELTVKRVPVEVSGHKSYEVLSKKLLDVNVGCVLEGSVKEVEQHLVIDVHLNDLRTGRVLWSDEYREEQKELINVQRYVAQKINDALKTGFNSEWFRPFVKTLSNPEAHTLYLKGRSAQQRRDYKSMQEANYYFRKALEKDPGYTLAYSGISDNYVILVDNGFIPYDSGVNIARDALNTAFRLDSNIAEVRASKAIFLTSLEGRRHEAMDELRTAIALSPGYTEAHQWYAIELAADGQFDSALAHINVAMELDPFSERIWNNKIMILTYARQYVAAIKLKDSLVAGFSNTEKLYEMVSQCYAEIGKKDSSLITAYMAGDGYYRFWKAYETGDRKSLQALIDSSLKHPEDSGNEILANYYTAAAQFDNAIGMIEKAYDEKEFFWLKFLHVDPVWDPLRNKPGFQKMLRNLGFK